MLGLLMFVHRWLGVALSLVFLVWFVSGIVMMYWGFPGVTPADRLARAPVLEAARVTVTAQQALAVLESDAAPGQVRLTSFDGRPVYRFGGGRLPSVYADDGSVVGEPDEALADRAASGWVGRAASEATRTTVEEIDQWTVGGAGRGQSPLYKYAWPDGQQVYVGGETATVVQYTTRSSRFWAYLGAIPHWFYFTPLRRNGRQWYSAVVWSSLVGTVAALLGVVIAVWMYSPRQRYRHAGVPTSIPYKGWKRWHTITGLLFGVLTITWAFSGLLSMGPFPILDRLTELTVPEPGEQTIQAEGGFESVMKGGAMPLEAYEPTPPAAAIGKVPGFGVKEVEFASYGGRPVYVLTNGRRETRIVPVGGEPMEAFDAEALMRRLRDVAGGQLAELRLLHEYDAYYLDRRGQRPLPVVYARLNDAAGTRYYIDQRTATIVDQYSSRGWVNRWLYHGLHSLDFPWLYKYRPLWDVVVITLMLGGAAVCVTSIVLAWRVLARRLALVWASLKPPDEDLAADRS